ncbi:neuroblast differentiation-associated protein AHNAK [Narcine bancroftii]|uniref:neuroblast differentiation-associated protein AHNAK n=1 Tax=Narcine bancroftii TaxID=1343680 RepID=UPI00383232B5
MHFSTDTGTAVILPGSGAALSDELTLTDSPRGGVIIEDIQKDSPVARAGTLKKGDQLKAVTIHFDDLNSEEVGKILKYTEPYKTSLNLNAKGEVRSPGYGYKTAYMGGGDQTYLKLYNSKIKPHLKLAKTSTDVGGLAIKGKTPSIDISGPKISSDFDMNQKTSPTIDVKTPKIGGGLASDINIKSPKGAIKMPDMELKGPGFEMPSKSLKTDINTPGFEIKSPKGGFDVNTDLQAPKFEMPSSNLHGPNISSFDTNLNLQAPKVKDVDLDLSTPNIDIDAPNIQSPNFDISAPKINDIGTEGKIKFPKFKKPAFSLSGNKPKEPELEVSIPDVKADLRSPDVDLKGGVDLPETKGKWKMPSFQMPSIGLNGPRGPDVDLNGSVKAPDVDISGPNLKGNLETTDINLKLPKGDIDANLPDTGGKFKLPGIKLLGNKLSLSGPDTGVNLPKGQIDLSAPDIQGDMKGPNFDLNGPNIDINAPNVDMPDAKGKFKMPNLKVHSFGLSGPKGPDVDFDGSIKAPGVDVSAPNLKGNFETPDADFNLTEGNVEINNPRAEINKPKFKMPTFNVPNALLSTPDTSLNLKAPKLSGGMEAKGNVPKLKKPNLNISGIEGPDVNFGGKIPDVDISPPDLKGGIRSAGIGFQKPQIGADYDMNLEVPEVKLKGAGLKKPSLNMPAGNVSGTDVDLNLSAPNVDFPAPNIKGDFKGPNIDIKAPKVDGFGGEGKFKFPKFKKPTFSLSGNKPKVPEVDVSMPDVKTDLKSPDVDLKGGVDLPETKAKWKMPSFQMPSFGLNGPRGPDLDFDGSLRGSSVDVSGPNLKGNVETPDIDMKVPKGGVDANLPDAGGRFKLPEVKWPSNKLSLSGPDTGVNLPKGQIDLSAPDIQGDMKGPNLDLKGPNIDINAPKVDMPDAKGKFKMPNLKVHSFGLSGPKGPDVDFDGSIKAPGVDVSAPNLKGNFETPDADFNLTEGNVEINTPRAEINKPKFKMPTFNVPSALLSTPDTSLNLKAPTLSGGMEAKGNVPKLKKPNLNISGIEGPDVNFGGKIPDVDISPPDLKGGIRSAGIGFKKPQIGADYDMNLEVPEVKLKGPSLKKPSLNMPAGNVSGPDMDLNLSAPNVDFPAPNIKGDFKGPNIDINAPKVDGFGGEGKFKFPKFKKPIFSLSGNKPKVPEVDVSMPDVKTDLRSPDVDLKGGVDLPETKAKWKMPIFQMPSFGLNGPRGPDVDFDGSVRAPSVDVSGPNLKGNVETPDIDMKVPKGGIDANLPDAGGRFKLPGIKSLSNKLSLSGPDTGVNLPKGQIDLSAPDIQGDMKGPNFDLKGPNIDINAPNVDMPDAKGKFKMPSLKMQSFDFSGPKGADVDLNGSVKAPDVDISGPNLKGNLETPDINLKLPKGGIDANLPDAEGKFKLPGIKSLSNKLSLSGPDTGVNLPKGQIDLSAPDIQGDMKGPNFDLNGPNIDINAPNVDMPDAKGKFKMPNLKVHSFGLSGPKGPDVDFDGSIKAPGVDVSAPNLEGNFETPDADFNFTEGNVEINTPRAEINKPKFKMPTFNVPNALLSTPDTSLNLKAPKLSGGMEAKGNVPKLKKPNLNISGIEGPDVNFGGKIPDVDISPPDLKGGIRSAGIGFKKPQIGADYDMNLEVPEVKLKGPSLKKPSLNMPAGNVSGPDVDLNLSAPNVDFPAPNIKGDFKGPNIDINAPKVDGFGGEGKFKFPKFKKPIFSLSGNKPKVPEVDISMPDVKTDLRSPDVDLKGGVDLPETKAKWKMPIFQMPSFGLNGPRGPDVDFDGSVRAPSVDVSGPNLKGNVETPDIDMKVPKGGIDANLPDAGGRFKLPGIKSLSNKLSLSGPDTGVNLPKGQIDLSAPDIQGDMKGPNFDLKGPNIDINAPNVDMPDAKGKFKMPSLKMQSFDFSGPKGADVDLNGSVKAPDVDISGPNLKGNLETPDINLKLPKGGIDANLPDTEGKFKLPGIKSLSNKLSLSGPDTGVNLPKGQIDLSAPDIQGDMKGPNFDLNGPNIDINAPNVDMPDAKGKFKMPNLKVHSFGLSGPKGPDVDFDGSIKAPGVDVSAPNLEGNFETPDADFNFTEGNVEINTPRAEINKPKFKMPTFNVPSALLSTPDTSLNLKAPTLSGGMEAKGNVPKLKKPNLNISGIEGPDVNFGGKIPDVDISPPDLKGGIRSAGIGFKKPQIGTDYDMNLEVPEVKLKGPGLKKPSLNMPTGNVSGPDMDLNLAPNVDFPASNIKGDFKGPNIDINAPKVDGFGGEGKFKFPKFKKPTFSLSGNKPKVPEVDVSMPDMKADLRSPDVDLKGGVDLPETKGKWKILSFQMPSIGLNGPRGPDVDLDGSVKAPDVDVSGPNIKGNLETPNIDMKVPKGGMDANLPDAGGRFKLPEIKWPSNKLSLSGPNTGVNLPKGQIDLSTPDIQGDMKGPNLDLKGPNIDINAPKGDVPETEGKFKMPSLKMPFFGFSGPRGSGVDLDGSVKAPDVDISGPNFEGNYDSPDLGMQVPNGNMNIEIPQVDLNKQHFATPSLNKLGPNWSSPDAKFGLKTPTSDLYAKLNGRKLKNPNLEFSGIEGPSINVDGNVEVPKADITAASLKAGMDLKKPKAGMDFDMPVMDLDVPDISVKGPDLKKPSFNVSPRNMDLNLPTSNIRGGAGVDMADALFKGKNVKGDKIGGKDTKFNYSSPILNGEFREVGVDVSPINPSAQLNDSKLKLSADDHVNMQNKFSRETFKLRSSSVSDLDDANAQGNYDANLRAKSYSTININDTSMNKKGKFKFSKFFTFNHKSKGSVDFTKAKATNSPGIFTSKHPFPELEFSVSKD